jgi:hypothetical protein
MAPPGVNFKHKAFAPHLLSVCCITMKTIRPDETIAGPNPIYVQVCLLRRLQIKACSALHSDP